MRTSAASEHRLDRLVGRLPAPRLQLRWERNPDAESRYDWICHYELVMPLREHDIRREAYGDDGEMTGKLDEFVVPMGEPSKRGSFHVPCTTPDGGRFADSPFRDGAHAQWDAKALGSLPVYVVAPDGEAFLEAPNAGNKPASRSDDRLD